MVDKIPEMLMNETWVHRNTPETKEQSKQWIFPVEIETEDVSCFLGMPVVKFTSITLKKAERSLDTIIRSCWTDSNLKQKWTRKIKLFSIRKATGIQEPRHHGKIAWIVLFLYHHILQNCPYATDRKRFKSTKGVIFKAIASFRDFDSSYYAVGIKKLKDSRLKCIELNGDDVEK